MRRVVLLSSLAVVLVPLSGCREMAKDVVKGTAGGVAEGVAGEVTKDYLARGKATPSPAPSPSPAAVISERPAVGKIAFGSDYDEVQGGFTVRYGCERFDNDDPFAYVATAEASFGCDEVKFVYAKVSPTGAEQVVKTETVPLSTPDARSLAGRRGSLPALLEQPEDGDYVLRILDKSRVLCEGKFRYEDQTAPTAPLAPPSAPAAPADTPPPAPALGSSVGGGGETFTASHLPVRVKPPYGWSIAEKADEGGARVTLEDGADSETFVVIQTYPETAGSLHSAFRDTEARKRQTAGLDYRRGFLRDTDKAQFKGTPAAAWDYTEQSGATRLHIRKFGFKRAGRNWEVRMVAPDGDYAVRTETFHRILDDLEFTE